MQDLKQIKELAISEWSQFEPELTPENWEKLYRTLTDDKTYTDLMMQSDSFVCENNQNEITGFGCQVVIRPKFITNSNRT